jgi:hypothetical protein
MSLPGDGEYCLIDDMGKERLRAGVPRSYPRRAPCLNRRPPDQLGTDVAGRVLLSYIQGLACRIPPANVLNYSIRLFEKKVWTADERYDAANIQGRWSTHLVTGKRLWLASASSPVAPSCKTVAKDIRVPLLSTFGFNAA